MVPWSRGKSRNRSRDREKSLGISRKSARRRNNVAHARGDLALYANSIRYPRADNAA